MALTDNIVTAYKTAKSNVETSAGNVATAIAQNDVLAWHSKKDDMFYVVKVANKTVSNNVVDLTVYGVCFKFDSSVPSTIANVNSLLYNQGFIDNSKLDILNDIWVGTSFRLAKKIAYIKFFGRKTFSISDLMFSNTSNFIDDIEDLTVIVSFTKDTGTVQNFGPEGGINGVTTPDDADDAYILLPGAARQLAWSCRHSIM